jgi:hypothetical protein
MVAGRHTPILVIITHRQVRKVLHQGKKAVDPKRRRVVVPVPKRRRVVVPRRRKEAKMELP